MSQARRQYEAKVQALQKAEAEIERLSAINAELLEALKKTLSYTDNWPASFTAHDCWKRDAASARAAIAKAQGEQL